MGDNLHMKIALVGGSELTAEVLERTATEFFEHENINARILAVSDPDSESPGMVMGRRLGLLTVNDYTDLFDPYYDIKLIIVLRPEPELLYDIIAARPKHIRIMSLQTFTLFWEAINIESNKLRERTQEIKAIFDNIQDFILVFTPEMTIIEANKAFLEQMGFTRQEVIGRKCYEVFQRINRQCQCSDGQIVCPLEEVITTNSPSQRIFPRVNREGRVVYIEVTIYPIHEQDGSISRFIEISRDVTKREKTDEEINRRLEQMVEDRTRELKKRQEAILHQDKMASLGKLSASVVHEINNPISGILNLVLLMKRVTEESALLEEKQLTQFSRYLQLMETETRRISRISSNLLSFSRESKLETSILNLHQLLEDVLFLNSNFLKINSIKVARHFDSTLPDIMADGEQLKQVFMNLVSNAVEAMEQHGKGTLTITTEHRSNSVQVSFTDTGPGISQDDITRLFDPFFSTKTKGKGVGLGLSVAYGIIQQHCGTIFVDSNEGQGTTIMVRLPLKQPKHKYE